MSLYSRYVVCCICVIYDRMLHVYTIKHTHTHFISYVFSYICIQEKKPKNDHKCDRMEAGEGMGGTSRVISSEIILKNQTDE